MEIRILVRKGVSESLDVLGEAEGNSALSEELKEKTGITNERLKILLDEDLVEKGEEKVLAEKVPIKRKCSIYNISGKGKKLLTLCEGLSDEEAKDFLRVWPQQLVVLRMFLKEGPKRARDVSDTPTDRLMRMVKRGLLDKKVEEVEETHDVYRLKRTYTLTEKGDNIWKALKSIRSL